MNNASRLFQSPTACLPKSTALCASQYSLRVSLDALIRTFLNTLLCASMHHLGLFGSLLRKRHMRIGLRYLTSNPSKTAHER